MRVVGHARRNRRQRLQADPRAYRQDRREPLAQHGIAGAQPLHHGVQRARLFGCQVDAADDAREVIIRHDPGDACQRSMAKHLAAARSGKFEQGFAQSAFPVRMDGLAARGEPERQRRLCKRRLCKRCSCQHRLCLQRLRQRRIRQRYFRRRLGADDDDVEHAEVGCRHLRQDVDPGVAIAGQQRSERRIVQGGFVDVDDDAAV